MVGVRVVWSVVSITQINKRRTLNLRIYRRDCRDRVRGVGHGHVSEPHRAPEVPGRPKIARSPVGVAEVTRPYCGLRTWVEQSYKLVK